MIANYFKIGFRNLIKRKGYSLLNILGLTIGMTSCLLIFHYVSYERSYDSAITNAANIYRVRLDNYQNNKLAWKSATSYPGIPPAMKEYFPEVEDYCRLIDAEMLLANDATDSKFSETKGYYADQSFVNMFDMEFLSGNASLALTGPDKMIISEKMAIKYFGTNQALGKKLTVKNRNIPQAYEITGVFKEHPKNSHLTIEYLVSYDTFKKLLRDGGDTTNSAETSFGWYDFYSYVQLKPGTDVKKVEAKFPAFCDQYIKWTKNSATYHEIYLTPVADIHLYSNYNQEAEVNGNGQMVSFLFLVAIFIICIAWINYINLSTARSVERAKEVGMKKVLGAVRGELVRQFLVENFLLNGLSVLLSLAGFFMLLKGFDAFAGRDLFTGMSLTSGYWQIFAALFLGGTLLSGLYPAFVLSGFQPIKVLKGSFKNTSGGLVLRKSLIVVQFVITVVLIAGTVIVYQQVQYMRKQNLGANIDQTIVLNGPSTIRDSLYSGLFQSFKTELLQQRGIKYVSASSNVLGQEIYWTNGARRLDVPKESAVTLYNIAIDYDFIPAYDMKLKAGRNFSKEFGTDRRMIILNEKAAALLGFEDANAAVDKKIKHAGDTVMVVGVLADYHHQGLQKMIDPMIVLLMPNMHNYYSVKMTSADPSIVIMLMEKTWKKYFPGDPFNYFFLDDTFDQQYKTDILFGKVFGIFALIAILIACSGLLGLSAYNVLQRHKEIGIRKVLGASAQNILILLSKDFIKLISISLLIALPFGWYIMNSWLQDFAYRIDIHWWVFPFAGLSALFIAATTIVLQAFKALIANPVKSLRTE